jgi:drug/metabolite transporter (DMT)-like permease
MESVTPNRRRIDFTTIVLLTLPPLIWAGNAVIGRAARTAVPPFHLNFLRWAFAGLALLPFVARELRGIWPVLKKTWKEAFLMGLLGVTCYNSLQYLALTTTSPINTSLIASSGPVFSLLLGVLLFGERVRGGQVAGAAISLLGVAWVMVHGEPTRLASIDFERGDVYMLLATMCWALYTWLVRRKRPDMPMGVLLFVQICFGLIAAVPPLLYENATSSMVVKLDWHLVAVVAYISLMASLFAYFCWDEGVARAGAQLPMFFQNLSPVFAALIATLTIGESPRAFHVVGLAFILAGIVLASRAAKKVRPMTAPV